MLTTAVSRLDQMFRVGTDADLQVLKSYPHDSLSSWWTSALGRMWRLTSSGDETGKTARRMDSLPVRLEWFYNAV